MGNRLDLQQKLEDLLGLRHVYYQPPSSVKMEYPAIVYSKQGIQQRHADNTTYLINKRYSVTVISRIPDEPVIDKLLMLPYCSYDRNYKADNLYHDVLILYY